MTGQQGPQDVAAAGKAYVQRQQQQQPRLLPVCQQDQQWLLVCVAAWVARS
jgi:hypothetical protein